MGFAENERFLSYDMLKEYTKDISDKLKGRMEYKEELPIYPTGTTARTDWNDIILYNNPSLVGDVYKLSGTAGQSVTIGNVTYMVGDYIIVTNEVDADETGTLSADITVMQFGGSVDIDKKTILNTDDAGQYAKLHTRVGGWLEKGTETVGTNMLDGLTPSIGREPSGDLTAYYTVPTQTVVPTGTSDYIDLNIEFSDGTKCVGCATYTKKSSETRKIYVYLSGATGDVGSASVIVDNNADLSVMVVLDPSSSTTITVVSQSAIVHKPATTIHPLDSNYINVDNNTITLDDTDYTQETPQLLSHSYMEVTELPTSYSDIKARCIYNLTVDTENYRSGYYVPVWKGMAYDWKLVFGVDIDKKTILDTDYADGNDTYHTRVGGSDYITSEETKKYEFTVEPNTDNVSFYVNNVAVPSINYASDECQIQLDKIELVGSLKTITIPPSIFTFVGTYYASQVSKYYAFYSRTINNSEKDTLRITAVLMTDVPTTTSKAGVGFVITNENSSTFGTYTGTKQIPVTFSMNKRNYINSEFINVDNKTIEKFHNNNTNTEILKTAIGGWKDNFNNNLGYLLVTAFEVEVPETFGMVSKHITKHHNMYDIANFVGNKAVIRLMTAHNSVYEEDSGTITKESDGNIYFTTSSFGKIYLLKNYECVVSTAIYLSENEIYYFEILIEDSGVTYDEKSISQIHPEYIPTDNITTGITDEFLRAKSAIEVSTLPTTNILTETVYRVTKAYTDPTTKKEIMAGIYVYDITDPANPKWVDISGAAPDELTIRSRDIDDSLLGGRGYLRTAVNGYRHITQELQAITGEFTFKKVEIIDDTMALTTDYFTMDAAFVAKLKATVSCNNIKITDGTNNAQIDFLEYHYSDEGSWDEETGLVERVYWPEKNWENTIYSAIELHGDLNDETKSYAVFLCADTSITTLPWDLTKTVATSSDLKLYENAIRHITGEFLPIDDTTVTLHQFTDAYDTNYLQAHSIIDTWELPDYTQDDVDIVERTIYRSQAETTIGSETYPAGLYVYDPENDVYVHFGDADEKTILSTDENNVSAPLHTAVGGWKETRIKENLEVVDTCTATSEYTQIELDNTHFAESFKWDDLKTVFVSGAQGIIKFIQADDETIYKEHDIRCSAVYDSACFWYGNTCSIGFSKTGEEIGEYNFTIKASDTDFFVVGKEYKFVITLGPGYVYHPIESKFIQLDNLTLYNDTNDSSLETGVITARPIINVNDITSDKVFANTNYIYKIPYGGTYNNIYYGAGVYIYDNYNSKWVRLPGETEGDFLDQKTITNWDDSGANPYMTYIHTYFDGFKSFYDIDFFKDPRCSYYYEYDSTEKKGTLTIDTTFTIDTSKIVKNSCIRVKAGSRNYSFIDFYDSFNGTSWENGTVVESNKITMTITNSQVAASFEYYFGGHPAYSRNVIGGLSYGGDRSEPLYHTVSNNYLNIDNSTLYESTDINTVDGKNILKSRAIIPIEEKTIDTSTWDKAELYGSLGGFVDQDNKVYPAGVYEYSYKNTSWYRVTDNACDEKTIVSKLGASTMATAIGGWKSNFKYDLAWVWSSYHTPSMRYDSSTKTLTYQAGWPGDITGEITDGMKCLFVYAVAKGEATHTFTYNASSSSWVASKTGDAMTLEYVASYGVSYATLTLIDMDGKPTVYQCGIDPDTTRWHTIETNAINLDNKTIVPCDYSNYESKEVIRVPSAGWKTDYNIHGHKILATFDEFLTNNDAFCYYKDVDISSFVGKTIYVAMYVNGADKVDLSAALVKVDDTTYTVTFTDYMFTFTTNDHKIKFTGPTGGFFYGNYSFIIYIDDSTETSYSYIKFPIKYDYMPIDGQTIINDKKYLQTQIGGYNIPVSSYTFDTVSSVAGGGGFINYDDTTTFKLSDFQKHVNVKNPLHIIAKRSDGGATKEYVAPLQDVTSSEVTYQWIDESTGNYALVTMSNLTGDIYLFIDIMDIGYVEETTYNIIMYFDETYEVSYVNNDYIAIDNSTIIASTTGNKELGVKVNTAKGIIADTNGLAINLLTNSSVANTNSGLKFNNNYLKFAAGNGLTIPASYNRVDVLAADGTIDVLSTGIKVNAYNGLTTSSLGVHVNAKSDGGIQETEDGISIKLNNTTTTASDCGLTVDSNGLYVKHNILYGTTAPTSSQGKNGDIYVLYST